MIDEKRLIEVIDKNFGHTAGASVIKQIIKEQPKLGEWIPVEERLPKQWEPVLVTYISVFNELLCDDCAMINENGNWIWCFDESLVELQIIA